ncbi:MAG: hypothetical protein V2J10_05440 [Wenzhouxiangella sp.]|jgi:catechol 2,3-dioxygenase-like lactoylglutathione lyase family enzyme|nr:hypothetical protein [Wenzhouxiangella sp.]
MKRLHVNLSVEDLDASVRFYSRLFSAEPEVLKSDYARSTKRWITDPQGVSWETFLTRGEAAVYGHDHPGSAVEHAERACC